MKTTRRHLTGGPEDGWPLYQLPYLVHGTFDRHLLKKSNKAAWVKDRFWAPETGGTPSATAQPLPTP